MKIKCQFVAMILLVVITLAACSKLQLLLPGIGKPTLSPTDTHNRIALLCMLSDINYDLVAASEQELSQNTLRINDALQNNADVRAYIGTDWQVVWGPAISNSKKNPPPAPSTVSSPTIRCMWPGAPTWPRVNLSMWCP